MSRIVVLGDVMVDVVAQLAGPVAPGSDAPSRNSFHGGGQAANTAAWLAAAGERPLLVARVGDDPLGRDALASLERAGVDARVAIDPDEATGTCVVLVGTDGERTMMPDAGANDRLRVQDLPDEVLAPGAHLHVAGYALLRAGSRPAARAAIERALGAGMTVSVDPSSAALLSPASLALMAGASLLLPNELEAEALTGEGDPELAARLLAGQADEVVVTLGPAGALWTDGTSVRRAAAPAVAEACDSTGAGDAFAAGLLAARLRGAGPQEALAEGSRLAARAVASEGARPRI
ncbi:MAG TPA: carbohydrate kinase family protein [Thermoleophilaceae bacterium]|nr:carbohydrate kinase family protein [Thermoleophilaceae bacterium]